MTSMVVNVWMAVIAIAVSTRRPAHSHGSDGSISNRADNDASSFRAEIEGFRQSKIHRPEF